MRYIFVAASILGTLCVSQKISQQCLVHNGSEIQCHCVANEEFSLPESFDYSNITSVTVGSCMAANIHLSSLTKSQKINDIAIQNISGELSLRLFLRSRNLRSLKLLGIGKIALIAHDALASLFGIENLHIEDTRIDNFEEQFTSMNVTNFCLRNVTIGRMIGINFSERGKTLIIKDCSIFNVQTILNFAYFENIEIVNSQFVLEKPGHVSIEGNTAIVVNSVFTNVSMNLVASSRIAIHDSCADGKSSLRLSANRIESFGNRLPTEIVYTRSSLVRERDFPLSVNNTVCIAGNCRCPKSAGHNSYERFNANVYLGVLLLVHVPNLI